MKLLGNDPKSGGLLGAGLYGAGACLCLERAESMEEDGL